MTTRVDAARTHPVAPGVEAADGKVGVQPVDVLGQPRVYIVALHADGAGLHAPIAQKKKHMTPCCTPPMANRHTFTHTCPHPRIHTSMALPLASAGRYSLIMELCDTLAVTATAAGASPAAQVRQPVGTEGAAQSARAPAPTTSCDRASAASATAGSARPSSCCARGVVTHQPARLDSARLGSARGSARLGDSPQRRSRR
jgi:hypothetical protein